MTQKCSYGSYGSSPPPPTIQFLQHKFIATVHLMQSPKGPFSMEPLWITCLPMCPNISHHIVVNISPVCAWLPSTHIRHAFEQTDDIFYSISQWTVGIIIIVSHQWIVSSLTYSASHLLVNARHTHTSVTFPVGPPLSLFSWYCQSRRRDCSFFSSVCDISEFFSWAQCFSNNAQ